MKARGEQINTAKLTWEDVLQIHAQRELGVKVKNIAAKYEVSRDTIYRVLKGVSWRHVDKYDYKPEENK